MKIKVSYYARRGACDGNTIPWGAKISVLDNVDYPTMDIFTLEAVNIAAGDCWYYTTQGSLADVTAKISQKKQQIEAALRAWDDYFVVTAPATERLVWHAGNGAFVPKKNSK